MPYNSEKHPYPPFHPRLQGCVAHDRRMSHALEDCYAAELHAVAAYTYRSLLCEPADRTLSDLFNTLALEEIEHFRLLGELIIALGGNPTLRTRVQVEPFPLCHGDLACTEREARCMIEDAIREEKVLVDCYETLMSRTEDRVVRSVFSHLIADEQAHVGSLIKFQTKG